MAYYTYGGYVYLNNMTDTTNEHHDNFILNQVLDFYITSLSNLMDGMFESFTKLFVDRMLKMDELPCTSCVLVIKIQCMEQG